MDYPTFAEATSEAETRRRTLQRVHIYQQLLHLLIVQLAPEGWHFASSQTNDVAHSLIIRRQAALRKILFLKYSLQTRALLPVRRIRFVTLIAISVVYLASRSLLRIQPELGIRFPPLHIATN